MNYLKLEIRNDETQDLIASHDFKPSALSFVIDQVIANLKQRGTFLPNDICKASLTPQFDGTPHYESEYISMDALDVDQACQQVDWESANSPYALHFEGLPDPERPVAYWLLAMHPNTHRILYRRVLPPSALEQYVSEVKGALYRARLLRPEAATSYRFFACNDNKGKFLSLAELGRPAKAEGGIELLAPESVEYPPANKSDYVRRSKLVDVGKSMGDVALFVQQSALDDVDKHINQYPARESGGVLIGLVYKDTDNGELFVEVKQAIPAKRAEANSLSLRFTTETWQEINIEKRQRFPDQLTVGWYHSHPVTQRLLNQNGQISYIDLFFSKDDLFFHENFFKEPWHVALVVSPKHQRQAFYQWQSEADGTRKLIISGSYYILADNPLIDPLGDKK